MTIHLKWLDHSKTALTFAFPAQWTWDDLNAAQAQTDILLKDISHPVIFILDMTNTRIPNGALVYFQSFLSHAHAQKHQVVVVSDNPVLHALVNVMLRLNPSLSGKLMMKMRLDEVLSIIKSQVRDS